METVKNRAISSRPSVEARHETEVSLRAQCNVMHASILSRMVIVDERAASRDMKQDWARRSEGVVSVTASRETPDQAAA